ncbi:MAG TPA: DUF4157 domain-containing protein [Pyrinomonadaceae bacterium]|nr:DUF4157 domain-containing protein [Pyrinomonadaceae bacterium]
MTTHAETIARPAVAAPLTNLTSGLLQRKCACGGSSGLAGGCESCDSKKRFGLQTKLKLNEPGDIYEREADRIANQLMATPEHNPVSNVPPRIQRFAGQSNRQMDGVPTSVDRTLASPGKPMEPALQQDMESRFGHDFSRVRVHSDRASEQSARDVNAHAYTVGHHIVFGAGAFTPGTNDGRRLIAHELTHVVQQQGGGERSGSANSTGLVQRDTKDPGADEPAQTAEPAQEGTGTSESKPPDTALVNDRVDVVKVSCANKRIAFITKGATYLYTLTQCDEQFPEGSYSARVKSERKKNSLGFFLKSKPNTETATNVDMEPETLDEPPLVTPPSGKQGQAPVGDEETFFRFAWTVKRGQIDPIDLMKDQDTVPVDIGADTISVPTKEEQKKQKECILTLAPRTIIEANSGHQDLEKFVPKAMQDVNYEWNLVDVGLADITLRVGGHVGAFADWKHSAGQVTDICLSSSSRGGYSGRARFTIDGDVHFQIDLTAYMELVAQLLGLIDVGSIGGSITLSGTADLNGKFNALTEVDFDPKHPLNLKLATDIELAAMTLLELNLSAEAGLEILGYDIWKAEWPSVWSGGAGYVWTGGLTFDNSFIPSVELGTVEKASPMQMQSTSRPARSSPGRGVRRASRREVPTRQLIEQAITGENGELIYDGSTRAKALPLQWFKPKSLYPQEIPFDSGVNPAVRPSSVKLEDGPTWVHHDPVQRTDNSEIITGPSRVGVQASNFPEATAWSKGFQFQEDTGTKSRDNSNEMRELVRGLGWHASAHGADIDHVRELQFGGQDQAPNLWPFGNSENRSAGPLHQQQISAFRDTVSPDLQDRWMRINRIGLTKDYTPRWGPKGRNP